jgi:uncharacterized protein YbgA (DUF1722 family)/uncharacterized protein YbbK (DUF523 family)
MELQDLRNDSQAWKAWHDDDRPIRLGISTCLLGEAVRYDGGHCHDRYLTGVLGRWVEWTSICPEAELGMGIPRPTLRLERGEDETRLVAPSTGEDWTDRMNAFAERRIEEAGVADLDGYVLKKSSPSCGLSRLKIYVKNMPGERDGVGLFAAQLAERCPDLPLEEEGRLNDPTLRQNFIERVFARNRWRGLIAGGLDRGRLVEFHTAHKLLLRSHSEPLYQELGRIVGSAGQVGDAELFSRYGEVFHRCLALIPKVKAHVNVLEHAMGYLKKLLDPREKQLILEAVAQFRRGVLPLVVPQTLIRYNVERHEVEYLRGQLYFEPNPKELMLRNPA